MKPKEIQDLLEFIAQSGLEEVSLETEQIKLAVKRNQSANYTHAPIAVPAIQHITQPQPQAPLTLNVVTPKVEENTPEPNSSLVAIKSPMIGTYYAASSPDTPNFVNVGDEITKGQVVCIIEAMKLFNEIESDISGRLVKILLTNATPVEFDQPLFLIEPN